MPDDKCPRVPDPIHALFADQLPKLLRAQSDAARRIGGVFHIRVRGPGGGEWTLDLSSSPPTCREGLLGCATATYIADAHVLTRALERSRLRPSFAGVFTQPDVHSRFESVEVSGESIKSTVLLGLSGTHLKIDNLGHEPKLPTGEASFIDFGVVSEFIGLKDMPLEFSPPEYGLGDYSIVQSLVTAGLFFADRVRFRVNNLRTTIGANTLTLTLGHDDLVVRLAFENDHPLLRGEAHAYILPFGIPIGWRDSLCPDIDIHDLALEIRLAPYLQDGRLRLELAKTAIVGDLSLGVLGTLESSIRSSIADAFATAFEKLKVGDMLGSALQTLIETKLGHSITGIVAISVEPGGVRAMVQSPAP